MSKEENKNSKERKPSKAVERRPERDFQPHMAPNYLVNTLLRDSLRNNLPPDFRSRILSRLQAAQQLSPEQAAQKGLYGNFTEDNLDEALGAAMADINFASSPHTVDSLPSQLPAKSPKRAYVAPEVIRVEPRFWHYKNFRLAAASATIAASILGGWLAFRSPSADDIGQVARNTSSPIPNAASQQTGIDQQDAIEQATASNDSTELIAPALATPKTIPEAAPKSAVATAAESLFNKPQTLPANDLVSIVNSQIAMTWENAKITKNKFVGDDQWLSRVTQIATGRTPTAAEQEAFRTDKGAGRFVRAAERLTTSRDFQVHWSRLLVEHYLGKSIPTLRAQPHNVQQFGAWLQDSLKNDVPIAQLEASIVFPDANPGTPSANFWFNETINRELLTARERERYSKLAFKYDASDAPIVNLTSNALHRSGFSSASCVQCHSPSDKALDFVAAEGGINQKQFWSMSAYLMDSSAKAGLHRSNNSNELFYEEDNGRVTVASTKLNVEVAGKSHSVDLKDWFMHNPAARNGIVEFVWKNIFFQPLVPNFGLSATEAFDERQDLKHLLSSQLQATGNLQKLVSSLLLVDALKSTDAAVTSRWYLRAQDEVLSAYHLRSRLFAFVPSPARQTGTIRTSRDNEIIAWVRGTHHARTQSQLAQPDNVLSKQSGSGQIQSPFLQQSTPKSPELDPSQLLYAISLAKPYSRLSEYALRVSNSKLQWQDQVHHAYWLSDGRMATGPDLSKAQEIHSLNNNDSHRSLIEILVGLTGSY